MRPSSPLLASLAERPQLCIGAEQERAWRLQRHGLRGGAALSALELSEAHVGLHAARQLTPWVTMHARDGASEPAELRRALQDRALLKLRCMRRTLHLVSPHTAPIVHQATLRQRLAPGRLAIERSGMGGGGFERLSGLVVDELEAGECAYRQLEHAVVARTPRRSAGSQPTHLAVRLVIKQLWEQGELLVGDASDSLHHEARTFALTRRVLPTLDLDEHTPARAVELLLERYLRAYGPASPRDFLWWSGLTHAEAVPAFAALAEQLVRVHMHKVDVDLLMLEADAHTVSSIDTDIDANVTVLAYEDPTLKGYFATRERYADAKSMGRLFNQIGEARASVQVGGLAAVVWHWDRSRQTISTEPLIRLARDTRQLVAARLEAARTFLRSEPLNRPGQARLAI